MDSQQPARRKPRLWLRTWRALIRRLARTPGLSKYVVRNYHSRRYLRNFGRRPDLRRPRLFTEFIIHRIVNDRDPLLKVASDKVAVRGWIDRLLGPGHTVPLLGVWERVEQIDWMRLPTSFVIKPSHSSGPFKIVERLDPTHFTTLKAMASAWLEHDYFDTSLEWGYRDVPRRITAEPLLRSPDGGSLVEVDVFTFHGRPRILLAFTGPKFSATERCAIWLEESGARSDIYGSTALAENVLDAGGVARMEQQVEAARPQMLEWSRRIGAHFSYVRVDFYLTDAGPKIGELTSYPAAGCAIYRPEGADARLGQMLRDSGIERRNQGLPPFNWPPLD